MTMISGARVKKLFAYLLPLLGTRSKAELDRIYADVERILGHDAKKASRLRQDARERDNVMDALMTFTLARPPAGVAKKKPSPPPRMSMPERTLNKM